MRRACPIDGRDAGASAVEYGLLIAGIAALIAVAVYLFGDNVLGLYHRSCVALYTNGCG